MWNEYSNAFYRSVYMFTLKANNTNQTGTRLMAFAFASLALALALLAALAHASLNCKDMMSVIFSIPRSVWMVQCSSQFGTPPKINVELRTWKWWFGRWFSFSRHVRFHVHFRGAGDHSKEMIGVAPAMFQSDKLALISDTLTPSFQASHENHSHSHESRESSCAKDCFQTFVLLNRRI